MPDMSLRIPTQQETPRGNTLYSIFGITVGEAGPKIRHRYHFSRYLVAMVRNLGVNDRFREVTLPFSADFGSDAPLEFLAVELQYRKSFCNIICIP